MARDGSGNYNLPAGQPVVTGTTIDSTVFNTFTADVAAAITASIAKDGQTTPTANLPMGGFKHTGVADGTARTHYGALGQLQDGGIWSAGSVAGTNTVTGSLTPAISSYVNGMTITLTPAATNTGAVTLALNGLTAKPVLKGSGAALVAGDLVLNLPATLVYGSGGSGNWYLQNPMLYTFADGTAAAPAMSFTSDTDVGMYRIGANSLGLSTGGTLRLQIQDQILFQDGTASAPTISFINDPNTGLYRIGSDDIGVASNGTQIGDWSTSQLAIVTGTVGAPAFSFLTDPNTGIYRIGADNLGVSVGGTKVMDIASGNIDLTSSNVLVNGQNVRNTAILNAGTLADARVAQSNVTQHQAAISLATSQLTGNMPDARIVASNVTQHNASITARNISGKTGIAKTLSTSAPSGGSDGDIWYRY